MFLITANGPSIRFLRPTTYKSSLSPSHPIHDSGLEEFISLMFSKPIYFSTLHTISLLDIELSSPNLLTPTLALLKSPFFCTQYNVMGQVEGAVARPWTRPVAVGTGYPPGVVAFSRMNEWIMSKYVNLSPSPVSISSWHLPPTEPNLNRDSRKDQGRARGWTLQRSPSSGTEQGGEGWCEQVELYKQLSAWNLSSGIPLCSPDTYRPISNSEISKY